LQSVQENKSIYKQQSANDNKPVKIGSTLQGFEKETLDTPNKVIPLPKTRTKNSNKNNVSISAPITINASPGMDEEELARKIKQVFIEMEQEAQRR